MKKLLSKTLEQSEDIYLALMAYRDTPLVSGKSPAQLLFNRKLNTRLSSVELWRQRYSQQSSSNDRKDLPQLHHNQLIRVQSHRMGKPQWPDLGRVIRKSGPRSYDIETNDGRLLTRNIYYGQWNNLHRKFKGMNQLFLFQRNKHCLDIPRDREMLQNA